MAALAAVMIATAFLSGVFGMAGGLILVGVLLALLPLPTAMALHAVTQMASNGWRALLWRQHVQWRAVWPYMSGCALAVAAWSTTQYVPSKPVALILLGGTPFLMRALPMKLKPNPANVRDGVLYGSVSMSVMLLTGVSGPIVDSFFLGGAMDRRQIVATKATCQFFSHAWKLLYFGTLIDQAATLDPWMAAIAVACSMLGTSLARRLLEALTDAQFRLWANRIITVICSYYVAQGLFLLVRS